MPLTKEILNEFEEKKKTLGKGFAELAVGNPEMLKDMKRFMEMIELFNKNPKMVQEIKTVVEKGS